MNPSSRLLFSIRGLSAFIPKLSRYPIRHVASSLGTQNGRGACVIDGSSADDDLLFCPKNENCTPWTSRATGSDIAVSILRKHKNNTELKRLKFDMLQDKTSAQYETQHRVGQYTWDVDFETVFVRKIAKKRE